jgi:hypothetical protein
VANNSIRGRIRMPYCFIADFDGYQATQNMGETWLAIETPATPPVGKIKEGRLALDETGVVAAEPLQLELVPTRFTKAGVFLDAKAVRDGKSVTFWSDVVPLDADGRGRLPFWNHVLEIQRTDKTLSARMVGGGDGAGWMDLRPGPGA